MKARTPRFRMADALWVVLPAAAIACGSRDAPAESGPVTARDSAGVRVVENRIPVGDLPELALPDEPRVRIGSLDGPTETQLFRVSAATRLKDGRIAISNAGSAEIRVFAPDGRPLAAFGGEGEGPEEFGTPDMIWPFGTDSLLIYDHGLQRLSSWTPDGELLGVRAIVPKFMNAPSARGRLADGTLFFLDYFFDFPESGFAWAPLHLHRVDRGGARVDTVASVNGMQLGILDREAGLVGRPHFSPTATAVAGPDRIYVSAGVAYEIRVLDLDGRTTRIVRWTGRFRAVEAADVDAYRAARVPDSGPEERRARNRRLFEASPVEKQFATVSDLALSTDGRLWVREYRRPRDPDEQRWWIFDAEGRLAGRTRLPSSARVAEIGADYLILLERDDLDIEYVALYDWPG